MIAKYTRNYEIVVLERERNKWINERDARIFFFSRMIDYAKFDVSGTSWNGFLGFWLFFACFVIYGSV